MDQEIKRIKQKDYSVLDNKLLENMNKAGDLQSTLGNLAEFQQFLINQITHIDKGKKGVKIEEAITKNIENLKESFIRCSKVNNQNKYLDLQNLVIELKNKNDKIKNQIYMFTRDYTKMVMKETQKSFQILISHNEQMKKQLKQAYNNIKRLENENKQLKKSNITKDYKNSQIQQNKKQPISPISKFSVGSRRKSLKDQVQSYEHIMESKPFSLYNSNKKSTNLKESQIIVNGFLENFDSAPVSFKHQQNLKTMKKTMINQDVNQKENYHSDFKRKSNHSIEIKQIPRTNSELSTHEALIERKNGIMTTKQFDLQRKKSKQKIKIFSIV